MSSGFVTEAEIAEARKRRQEEWEKVRKPDQPLECPEEPYDGRTLYERLREQKLQKDLEYEEAHKLKNLVRGLDDDEVEFLDLVDKRKMDAEKLQMKEEAAELKDFRERVANIQEESIEKKIQSEIAPKKPKISAHSSWQSQKSLVSGGLKRKNGKVEKTETATTSREATVDKAQIETEPCSEPQTISGQYRKGYFKCIAILPGIGPYNDSSDSDISTGSDDEPQISTQYDLVGRKRLKKKATQSSE